MKKAIYILAISPLFLMACGEASEQAAGEEEKLTEYKAYGTEPGWSVEIKDNVIAYSSMEATNDFSLPVQREKKIATGWEIKGFSDQHNITVTITSGKKCNDGMSDREFADTVKISVSEVGYREGCGGDILSDPEATADTKKS